MSFVKSKFVFAIIMGLCISSCDDMELCFYEDDFGEIANRDNFYVYSSENNCFFNDAIAHSNSSQSYIVQKCIRETKLSTIKDFYNDELKTYFDLIKDFGATVDGGATCSQADPYLASNTLRSMEDNEDVNVTSNTETLNARQYIYTKCIKYCTNICAEQGIIPDTKWTKASLKTDNGYLGIKLTTGSYVYVTVSGNIVLSNDSNNKVSEYNTIGLNDVNYTNIIPGGDYLDLHIDYNTKNISLSNNDINNLKARTVLDFRSINNDLIVTNLDGTINYQYQEPIYNAFTCAYIESNNSLTKQCSFDFSNTIANNDIKDKITNYYIHNYIFPIFDGYTDLEYNSDIINNIMYINPITNNVVNNNQNITIWSEKYIAYKDNKNNFEYIDSYILSKGASSVSFKVNKPTKLAIKYIGTTNNNNIDCVFDIKDSGNYKVGDNDKVVKEDIEYKKIQYSAIPLTSTKNTNKWQVLKTGSGNEIIFNQFSTPDKAIESKIEVNLNTNSSHQDCSSGFLIKLIPLKDYKVTKTGLLFFDFVGISDSDVDIKYSIINPNVLHKSGLINEEYKLNDFYEGGNVAYYGGDENNAWKTVKSVNNDNIVDIDSNNFTNNLLTKSIFVRQGQIIRFDYSNWLNIDNLERISKKYDNFVSTNVARTLSLHVYIKERPAYFCVGSKREVFDIENECSSMGGRYYEKPVGTNDSSNNLQGKCYIEHQDCMVSNEIEDEYSNIDDTLLNCTDGIVLAPTDDVTYTKKLSDFWNDVYISYMNSERQDCYNTIIGKVYKLAQKCRNTINDNDYSVYKGVLDEHGVESYIAKVATLDDLNDVNTINEKVVNLNNFFGTKILITNTNKEENTNVDSGDNIVVNNSKSPFYYFKNICNPEDDGLCYTNEIPMCYDLTNYVGSTINFINRTMTSDDSDRITDMENYGIMNNNDVLLGAKRVGNFNGSNGLIRKFIEDSTVTDLDENYLRLKYETSIYINESSALRVHILNTINGSINFNELYEYFIKTTTNTPILKLQSSVKNTYKNGANLAVIVGENDKVYYSKPDGSIYYFRDDNNEEIVSESLDGNNGGNSIINIVKYDSSGSINTSTPYEFNEKGELVSALDNNIVGINFKTYEIGNNYIKSNDESIKNLFFKIIDVDNNSTNNENKYKVVIKEINESESGIITYFRNFFNGILHFVDGTYMNLEKSNGNFVACTVDKPEDGTCYIYNTEDVSKNGDICTKEVEHCYSACGLEGSLLQTCESVYNGKGFVKTIYETFINDPLYIFMAKMLLILSITWYGFGYFIGIGDFKQSEIIMKIIKICFIYFLISPNGWNFFNDFVIKFFKDCIDSVLFLIAGSFEVSLDSELSRAIQENNYLDKTLLFSGCFTNLEMIFSDTVFNKMLGLAFSGWVGLIYLYLVFSAVINYIIASFTAMVLYLSAQVYMSLIFCFFPLVILFMFFKTTEKTFDNWLNSLIGFAGQQIFLIMTLSFFNLLIYNFIRNTFSYTVCWLPLVNMNVGGIPLAAIQFWKIPGTTMSSTGLNTGNEAMPSFYSIITFYMIGVLMGKFISEMVSIGSNIFGGMSINGKIASKITGGLDSAGKFIKGQMKDTGKRFYKGMAHRLGGSQIKEFGESQKEHLKERREKRNQHFKDVSEKTKKDMKEYKKSNDFKNDILKEAKNNEFNKAMSKKNEEEDRKQKEKNDEIIKNRQAKVENTEEFNTLNKDVGALLQKRETGPLTKEEEQDLEKKQKRLDVVRNNKLSDKEYQEYTEAKKSNDEINKRNDIREQHRQNLEIIQKGQAKNATKEDKQRVQEAIKNEEQMANNNYDTLSDEQKELAQQNARTNILQKKQNEFEHNNEVSNLTDKYSEDITSSMIRSGISEEDWKNMKTEDKNKKIEEWGVSHGLIKKSK